MVDFYKSMDLNKLVINNDMIDYVLQKYGNNWQVDDAIADEILNDLLKIVLMYCLVGYLCRLQRKVTFERDDKRKVTRIKILDDLEQKIEKVEKDLNKAKEKMDLNKGKKKMVMEREVILIELDTSSDDNPFQVTSDESSDDNPFQFSTDESSDHNPFQVTSDESSDDNQHQASARYRQVKVLEFFDCSGPQQGVEDLMEGAQGDRETKIFQEKEYHTRWKIKMGNVLDSCNQRSTQQCMKSEVAQHLGVAGIEQQNGLVDETNVTLFAKVLHGFEFEVEPLGGHTFERKQFVVVAVDKIYAHESLTFDDILSCEVIFKWKTGLKEDMDARSVVHVLSNDCRKSSDDSHDNY
uniref:Zinc finger, CCHC-type n=1 Tax=Tanacetum cinerariifolium TaxID=118510 RepID=A0A699HEX6_TANCI|nr:zinc finger, CCHC-type [Tanacetum cinerariifolium]